ncbi:MAG: AAA family ATPase [Candidatus Micrarchaeota archaeon]|nr:AAA family ATPase [Candidatus Micrarchaeota archaeon]
MERVKTGIPGFDKLIEGGVPKGFNVLISGTPGTGKTIFGLQFLYNGAKQGQSGIYVSLDASDGSFRSQAEQFGWNLEKLEDEGKLSIVEVPLDTLKVNIFDMIEEEVAEVKAKRLVFDSLAAFAINIDQFAIPLSLGGEAIRPISLVKKENKTPEDKKYRYEVMPSMDRDPKGRPFYSGTSDKRITYLIVNELATLGTTNIVITGTSRESEQSTVDGVSEYACDGMVALRSLTIGETLSRTLEVKKMRCTKIDGGIKSYEFGKSGIVIE